MELKTLTGRAINANSIDFIRWEIPISGIRGTLVQLKTGEEVFLDNSEEEIVRTINELALRQQVAAHSCRTARQSQIVAKLSKGKPMKFRELPVLERKSGMMLWPPPWSSQYQPKETWPHGEIGTLESAWMHELLDQCVFLYIMYEGFQYTGHMYFDDRASCMMVFDFLKSVVGRTIAEIGDSDISHLL